MTVQDILQSQKHFDSLQDLKENIVCKLNELNNGNQYKIVDRENFNRTYIRCDLSGCRFRVAYTRDYARQGSTNISYDNLIKSEHIHENKSPQQLDETTFNVPIVKNYGIAKSEDGDNISEEIVNKGSYKNKGFEK